MAFDAAHGATQVLVLDGLQVETARPEARGHFPKFQLRFFTLVLPVSYNIADSPPAP